MDPIQSKQKLLSTLILSLALASCGGGSDSTNTIDTNDNNENSSQSGSDNSTTLGSGVTYAGLTSPAVALPNEDNIPSFVQAVVQVLKIKNIPAFKVDGFAKNLSKNEKTCQTGSSNYAGSNNAGTGLLTNAEVSFNKCAVQVSTGILAESQILNGELSYSMDTNLYSQTDSFKFKNLSIANKMGATETDTYLFDGSFGIETKSINGIIQPSVNWSMNATYSDPGSTLAFKTKGTLKHQNSTDSSSADESNTSETQSTFDSSFTFGDLTYKLEYSTNNIYSYNTVYESMKFYDPEMGYYHLDISNLKGKSCNKNGAVYSGLSGNVMVKDASGANLLSITIDCESVTHQ